MDSKKDKIARSRKWFRSLPPEAQEAVFCELLDFAIVADYVHVWSDADARELAEEENKNIGYYRAPYFSSCGEPIHTWQQKWLEADKHGRD